MGSAIPTPTVLNGGIAIRTPDDLAFRDELAVIARRHPQVKLGVTVSQGPASDRWHQGRITPDLVLDEILASVEVPR